MGKYIHHTDFSYAGLDQEIAALRMFWKSEIEEVSKFISGLQEGGNIVSITQDQPPSALSWIRGMEQREREMEAHKSDGTDLRKPRVAKNAEIHSTTLESNLTISGKGKYMP